MATVAELDIVFNGETGGAMAAFSSMQDSMFRVAMAGQKIGKFVTDGFMDMVGSSIDLETQMRNINSIAQTNEAQLGQWEESIQGLAMTWGESSVTLAEGMYQIQSAGFSAADSIDILESASMAARAGLTTTAVAADAVTSVLNSYRENIDSTTAAYQALNTEGERAEYVQNVLFRGVDRGKMTYEQLAGSIGRVAGVASTANLSIEDVVGSMALMTQQGLSADESATALYNTINAFIKPTEAMTTAVEELGYATPLAMIETLGWAGAMQQLELYTGGSADKIGELFGNIRGQRGATLLFNGSLEDMIAAMEDAQGGAGKLSAMEMALEQQTMSTQFAIDVFKATFEVLGQEFTQALLPAIRFVLGAFVDFAKAIVALPEPVKNFMGALIGLFGVIMSGVGVAALFLALFGPILPLLALLTAAVIAVSVPLAALFALFANFGFRDTVQGFSDIVDALDVPFLDHFTNSIERAAEAYQRFTGLMQTGTGFTQLDGFALSLGALGAALIAFADSTSGIDILDGPLGDLGQFLKDLAGPIDKFLDLWNKLNQEGTKTSSVDFYNTGEDMGDFERTYSRLTIFTKAWDGMVDSLHETFPNQAPLINATDAAVKGLIGTVSAAMAGEWSVAWESFQGAMRNGLEVAKIVGGNIKNAIEGIDWGGISDSIGSGLDSAFANITQAIDWVAYVAIPTVLGWLSEHAGDAWGAIKALAGAAGDFASWVGERATEIVNWTIDIAVPEVIGYGKYIMGNLRNWLLGQMGGGGIGFGSGAGMGSGGVGGELGELDLGQLIAKWAVDFLLPDLLGAGYAAWNDIKGWLSSRMNGKGADSRNGSMEGGDINLGEFLANWTINVLEPTVTGWITGAAAWLQAKLQSYVNGSGGSSGYSEGIGGTRGSIGGSGGLVQLAEWAIDVLEPIVNMDNVDIVGTVRDAINLATTGARYVIEGGTYALEQITKEDIENPSDIPGAIDALLDDTLTELKYIADVAISINGIVGGVGGDDTGGGANTGGGGGVQGLYSQVSGWLDEQFSEPFEKTVKTIVNYNLNPADPDSTVVDDLRSAWETAETWVKVIKLELDIAFPGWIDSAIDYLNKPADLFGEGLQSLVDFYKAYNDYLAEEQEETRRIMDEHKRWEKGIFPDVAPPLPPPPPNPVRPVAKEFIDNDSPSGFGHQPWPSITMLNQDRKDRKGSDFEAPDTGQVGPQLQTDATKAVETYKAAMMGLGPATQQSAQTIAPAWNSQFSGFGSGVVSQTRKVASDFGTGLAPMPNAASTTAQGATTNMSTGLFGMVGAAGSQAVGAVGSLRGGLAPMPGQAGGLATDTTGRVRGGLAPMPGQVGGIASNTGESFRAGITTGFVAAGQAAIIGAGVIRAAANSIGDLYGVGFGVGSSLGAGVADGIWSQVNAVAAASAALASAAAAGAQARGQISSPSRLMFNEVGVPLAEGVIAGINSKSDKVGEALDFNLGGQGAYTLPRSKVVAIYNTHQYVLEPEAWLEVQRDSRMSAQQLRDMNSRSRQLVRSKPQTR